MTVGELKDYLNGWSDDAEFCLVVINSKTRKVYLHPDLKFITDSYLVVLSTSVRLKRKDLKRMTKEEVGIALENHKHWLCEDCDGWESMKANLSGANLYRSNLCGADLYRANLCEANFCRADLRGADLREANLCGGDLYGADLYKANLYRADLYRANLYKANLREADLCGADLREANLCEADLRGAKLDDVLGLPPIACPDTGEFIAWKKASGKIVQLLITEDAKRSSATARKCRCSKAKVLSIAELDGSPSEVTEIASGYNKNFVYRIGETVEVADFDDDRWNECSTGIHFFITRQEAVEY